MLGRMHVGIVFMFSCTDNVLCRIGGCGTVLYCTVLSCTVLYGETERVSFSAVCVDVPLLYSTVLFLLFGLLEMTSVLPACSLLFTKLYHSSNGIVKSDIYYSLQYYRTLSTLTHLSYVMFLLIYFPNILVVCVVIYLVEHFLTPYCSQVSLLYRSVSQSVLELIITD